MNTLKFFGLIFGLAFCDIENCRAISYLPTIKGDKTVGKFVCDDQGHSLFFVGTDGEIQLELRREKDQVVHGYKIGVLPILEQRDEDGVWKKIVLRRIDWETKNKPEAELKEVRFRGKTKKGITFEWVLKKENERSLGLGIAIVDCPKEMEKNLRVGIEIKIPDMLSKSRTSTKELNLSEKERERKIKDQLKENFFRVVLASKSPESIRTNKKIGFWEKVDRKTLDLTFKEVLVNSDRMGLLKKFRIGVLPKFLGSGALRLIAQNQKGGREFEFWHEGFSIVWRNPEGQKMTQALPVIFLER